VKKGRSEKRANEESGERSVEFKSLKSLSFWSRAFWSLFAQGTLKSYRSYSGTPVSPQ
jgi:hypothetical protein